MTIAMRALTRRTIADARTRTLSFALMFGASSIAIVKGYTSTYPTAADRLQFVNGFADNNAARLFYGAGRNLTTVGGFAAWRGGGLLSIFAALFGIFAAVRALRSDEELGRGEIVLAGALTRTDAFVASILGVATTVALLWITTALLYAAGGLPVRGSILLGLAVASPAAVYVGIGALASQILPTRRSALEIAGGALAIDFALRVVADTTSNGWLRWAIPLGWYEQVHCFSGARPAVLLLPLATTAVLLAAAAMLNRRRDFGAALLAPHDTAPPRPRLLSSPTALTFRNERVALASWSIGIFAFAFIIGTIAKSVADAIPADLRDQLRKLGGIDVASAQGYIGLTFVFFVFTIAFFACTQIAAARDDESQHRLETLFALSYGRERWLGGRLVLAVVAIAFFALLAGTGAAAGAAASGAHVSVPRVLEGGANCIPACIFFLGAGALLFALLPRRGVGIVYGFVGAAFVWQLVGALLSAPSWVLDLSPFHHVAPTPAKPVAVTSATVMTVLGTAALTLSVVAFRHRDLAGD